MGYTNLVDISTPATRENFWKMFNENVLISHKRNAVKHGVVLMFKLPRNFPGVYMSREFCLQCENGYSQD